MKRKKILTGILVGVAVVAVAGAGTLYSMGYFGKAKAASTTSYQVVKLSTGDLEKSVKGTGTLSAGGSATQTIPVDMEIDSVKVKAGQNVKAGDTLATVNAASLGDTIATLQSDISTIDSELGKLASSDASVATVKSQVSGRVKQILCSEGSDVGAIMLKSGGLLTLSTDGKMKIAFTLTEANSTSVGSSVKVKTDGKTYTGLVESLAANGKACVVTLTDNGPALGAAATVATKSGDALGSGKLAINRPYTVPATAGTVNEIYVEENQKVSTRTSLVYLTGVPTSDSLSEQQATRKEKVAALNAALQYQKTGKITAAQDGTIQEVKATDGQAAKAGDTLLTMLTGGTISLDVSVDELDINSVKVGQAASVAVDAITDKTFDATVESISQIGTASSGVTTYTVSLKVAADGSLKVGMNATATIIIEKHSNALLLPMSALNTVQGKEYVWLYTGSLPTESSQDPGTRTEVTTGLSNDNYVEITSGLTADDQVVVVRTRSTNANSAQQNGNGFGTMGGMGGFGGMEGGMPGGGMGGQSGTQRQRSGN